MSFLLQKVSSIESLIFTRRALVKWLVTSLVFFTSTGSTQLICKRRRCRFSELANTMCTLGCWKCVRLLLKQNLRAERCAKKLYYGLCLASRSNLQYCITKLHRRRKIWSFGFTYKSKTSQINGKAKYHRSAITHSSSSQSSSALGTSSSQ